MADKYIGLLPYLYLDQPLQIGPIRFTPVLLNERSNGLRSAEDNRHLMNLLKLFKDGRGELILGATYFIIDIPYLPKYDSKKANQKILKKKSLK